jgi:hypothetical protein
MGLMETPAPQAAAAAATRAPEAVRPFRDVTDQHVGEVFVLSARPAVIPDHPQKARAEAVQARARGARPGPKCARDEQTTKRAESGALDLFFILFRAEKGLGGCLAMHRRG